MSYVDKLCEKMCYCMTVGGLRDILEDICDDGFEGASVAFRLGHCSDEKGDCAVCLPIADIRIGADPSKVLLTPAARVYSSKPSSDEGSRPNFDCHITFNEDSFTVKIEDLITKDEGEGNVQ